VQCHFDLRALVVRLAFLATLTTLPGCALLAGAAMPVVRWRSAEMFASGDAERSRVDIPGNLAQLRFLADLAPDHAPVNVAVAQALGGYALGYLDPVLTPGFEPPQDALAQARKAFREGRAYAMRGLTSLPGFVAGVDGDLEVFRAAVASAGFPEVPALFWMAYNWGQLALLSFDDIELSAEFEKAEMMMRRVEELAPGYYHGGAQAFLMVRYASRPTLLGGDPAAAKAAWSRAREASGGRFLMTDVLYAQYGCVQTQDAAEFRRVLEAVIATPSDVLPEERLANLLAQRRARILLDRIADCFDLEAAEDTGAEATDAEAAPAPSPTPSPRVRKTPAPAVRNRMPGSPRPKARR